MRFAEASVLKALHKDKFEKICEAYPKTLGKNFNSYKLSIVKAQKAIPLDYIMVLPPAVQTKIQSQTILKIADSAEFQLKLRNEKTSFELSEGRKMSFEEEMKFAETFVSMKEVKAHVEKSIYLENILKNETIRQIIKLREK